MPKIIVISEPQDSDTTVLLEERVEPAHLEDDHSAAQLVERLGWAILDAEEVEVAPVESARRPLPRHFASRVTEWTRETNRTLAA